ncbi:hypothetical protein DL769_008855 [Monosporascus sp. CRB-8-3]|nr:hypothetical protein DL769_008855 [Monosporascus sp. CRB-8-3]
MADDGNEIEDDRKRVLIVGAGAAGMSTAHHLSQHPEKFAVTLIDAVDYCGGQAFSIPLDKEPYGASWVNQGVQGDSFTFHHTCTMFARQGFHADPLLARHQNEVKRLVMVLKLIRWFEVFFALLPTKLVFKLFMFSGEFTNSIAPPMTAPFPGTGNATSEIPAIMLERLCTPPSEFYETWRKDLVSRGVTVRLSTELTEVALRNKHGVAVRLKPRTPVPDVRNPVGDDPNIPVSEEVYDEIVLCCLADTAKRVLGRTATWKKKMLGSAKFSDDVTITHNDSDYMKKHYENFYREDLTVENLDGVDQTSRLSFAVDNYKPMYYIKMYPEDKSKLEMCFDTTNYQCQFPQKAPFEQHIFQTIYLNKDRDRKLWSDDEIRVDRIIRKDWWHQLCHSYTHYLFVVPWMMFLQAKNHTRFAAVWTLVNAHEVAVMSGIAAAVDLGAEYPEDLENDGFAFLCFRLYYLLAYGKCVYKGPGVATVERLTWGEEVKKGRSTQNLAERNAPGRSQP